MPHSCTGSWPGRERDTAKATAYRKLAEVEDRHVAMWRKLLAENGHQVASPGAVPGSPVPGLGGPAGRDAGCCCPMLLEEEGREVKGYLDLYQGQPDGGGGPDGAARWPRNRRQHAETLAGLSGGERRSRGTRRGPADSSGTWSTASTTGSPPTSAWWPA